jgi:DHA1 family tetracycline resistance protein-like MFS transporter
MHFGGHPALVTQLVASYCLAGFLGSFWIGRWSDRFGRAPVLVCSLALTILAYLGMVFSWTLIGVFAFRVMAGFLIGRAGILRTLATDGMSSEIQVRRIGWLAGLAAIGTTLGPIVASVLSLTGYDGLMLYRATIGLAILVLILTLAAALLAFKGEGRREIGIDRLPRPSFRLLLSPLARPLTLTALTGVAQGVVMSVTALFGHARFGWGAAETGVASACIAAGLALGRIVMLPRLSKTLGGDRALMLSLTVTILAMIAVGLSSSPVSFLVSNLVFSCGLGVCGVLPTTFVSASAPAAHRGAALGANEGLLTLGIAISASTSGLWFEWFGPPAPYVVGALALAAALALARAAPRRVRVRD